jgi:hypothetical protein
VISRRTPLALDFEGPPFIKADGGLSIKRF